MARPFGRTGIYNPPTRLTWAEEDDGFEAGELSVCDVQLSERFHQLLLDSESHSGHLYLVTSQGDHKVVTCSIRINTAFQVRDIFNATISVKCNTSEHN